MKRLTITLILAMLAASAMAKPVDKGTLRRAAESVLDRTDLVDATPDAWQGCRLYTGADGTGFVLLATDYSARPLLGYSLTNRFPTDDIPEHVASWIDGYCRDVKAIAASGCAPSERAQREWRMILEDKPAPKVITINPLVKTHWDQSEGFFEMCPYDDSAATHCLTGCVATAGAQILRYWKHPAQGRGHYSYTTDKYGTLEANYDTTHYDWNNMPLFVSSATAQAKVDKVSRLMFHYGVAVEMEYSPTGSGAYSNPLGGIHRASSETALKEYFKYNPGLHVAYKDSYADAEWDSIILAELKASRPVLYDGYGKSGGHAFIVDGYDGYGMFHLNWGWASNGDGYFTLDSLAPGQNMSFSELSSAIIHIYPIDIEGPTATVEGVPADPAMGSVSGSGTYSTDSIRVALTATAAPGYRFDHWTSGNLCNPIITSPTVDYHDTAIFVPEVWGDTLGYCRRNGMAYKKHVDTDVAEWGIRLPHSTFGEGRQLNAVLLGTYTEAGPYIIRVYRGEWPEGDPLRERTVVLDGYGDHRIGFEEPLDLADTMPLWITVRTDTCKYPMGYSHYTGTTDGSWVIIDGSWQRLYEAKGIYGSWMIRAVTAPLGTAAIDAASAEAPTVSVRGRQVEAQHDSDLAIELYDMQGRCLATSRRSLRATVGSAGIYLVRVAGGKAARVVVY